MILFIGFLTIFSVLGLIVGVIFLIVKKTRSKGKILTPIAFVLAVIGFWYMGAPVHNKQSDVNKQETLSTLADTASVDTNEDEKENSDDTITHKVDWSMNENNVKFSIDQVSVVKQDLDSGDQGMIGVHFIIDNKSNKDISTYPTQGTLLTNTREQIKASVQSENFDGDIMSGAKKDGFVLFPIKKLNKPQDINSVRVKWDFWPDKNTSEGLKELDAQLSF
ncbi:hypothetical protein [Bacillus haynesii]|uniref:hypothetical protein n=2 Tax=Bacillus haynesii TaxID=1925021 RepID=UPI00227E4C19|nr:hypothetical protein [Bacillus haynesii]MCY8076690.1 hypothetical protein [Bacillus haynesii]MCY9226488.1 hypothetical protein [Bacillus haynesii]